MKSWDGMIDMRFKRRSKDCLYYDVVVSSGRKRVEIELPRYHPMIGGIEVFGLPPQNEWVVLTPHKNPFVGKGVIKVKNDKKIAKIKERIEIVTNEEDAWRFVERDWHLGKKFERQLYFEDWSQMKAAGCNQKRWVFVHSNGMYVVSVLGHMNPALKLLTKKQKEFLEKIKAERGKPTDTWLKQVNTNGTPPPLYKQLFPFWKTQLENVGSVFEIGYEKELSHGDWYKFFDFGKQCYEVQEDNWTSKSIQWKGKSTKIKNTYRKYVREV